MSAKLPDLLAAFHASYHLDQWSSLEDRLIAVVASHLRFEWLHPYLDGNGRVGRLALHAAMSWVVPGGCWWSVSYGLKKYHQPPRWSEYLDALEYAGLPREDEDDGPGPLSAKGFSRAVCTVIGDAYEGMEYLADYAGPDKETRA